MSIAKRKNLKNCSRAAAQPLVRSTRAGARERVDFFAVLSAQGLVDGDVVNAQHHIVGVADGMDDTNLEAKVGQGDDNAINLVAVLAELL